VVKKLEINGTQWEVQVALAGGAKGILPAKDTLTFQDGRFTSKSLNDMDFSSTNYTLTVQESGVTIFETMQTSEKNGIAFWRGEWKEDVMSGIISRQLEKGNEEYNFTSSSKVSISPTSEEKEEGETAVTTSESASVPATLDSAVPASAQKPSDKKEKTSWFL
jgi:hypothetical protein